MSAERLREAAKLMRARAEAATQTQWKTYEEHGRDITDEGWSEVGVKALGVMVCYTAAMGFEDNDQCDEDATHIASWHPAVALAVADWLDHEANREEIAGLALAALAVANAYLGGAS